MVKHSVALETPVLSWKNDVPIAERYGDPYFSLKDGLSESKYYFLEHNQLQARWQSLSAGQTFRIAETGFGSGLNFLAAWQLWQNVAPKAAHLHFISFELHPLLLQDLRKIHSHFSEITQLGEELQAHYPEILPGWHQIYVSENVTLSLWFGDLQKGLLECEQSEIAKVDAWFLDGFAPANNPEMWRPFLYQDMARLSVKEATFATFTAVGEVRRGLEKVGFSVQKHPGFAAKREMCFGYLSQKRHYQHKRPWFARRQKPKTRSVIIVGAGLAGAACADELLRYGFSVTVLEAEPNVASKASGNLAGTLHPLVTSDWNIRSQWYWSGMQATLNRLAQKPVNADLNGIVQLAADTKSLKVMKDAEQRVNLPHSFARFLSSQHLSDYVGQTVTMDGLYFPKGGWIQPRSVVENFLQGVDVHFQHKVIDWNKLSEQWSLSVETPNGIKTMQADNVVFATGALSEPLRDRLGVPIRPVKGQVTHFEGSSIAKPLSLPVTHKGYSSFAGDRWVSGATFEAPDMTTELSAKGHKININHARDALPDWLKPEVFEQDIEGRVAFRPTTPDHLPIIGPVPDWNWLEEHYLTQSHTHAVYRYPQLKVQSGLYVSNGHGARGLSTVCLSAQIIRAEICNHALPVSQSLYVATHPVRFKIREWRRGKLKSESAG